jgi:hypothetical protein
MCGILVEAQEDYGVNLATRDPKDFKVLLKHESLSSCFSLFFSVFENIPSNKPTKLFTFFSGEKFSFVFLFSFSDSYLIFQVLICRNVKVSRFF